MSPETPSPAAVAPHHPLVLVLDDDPAIRQLLTDYLDENDLRVHAVATGAALDTAMALDSADLLILDLRLPGEDGQAIARRLRESSAIPILMLTGRAEEADRVMGLELGADDYLTKPFSPRELLARIRALLRRAGMVRSSRVQACARGLHRLAHGTTSQLPQKEADHAPFHRRRFGRPCRT